ncbi:MAG TPA: glutamate racemase [Candidatus Hydrogenedentes bacterium]|nr:glutamate racemase [Candidatus Hydrogenedentota bacterium]
MKTGNPYRPIGVFDSGVGGLTVCRKIWETLPSESIVYLGDTARVPYGSKSASTVIRYALTCANLLVNRNIKLLVVACNTATAFALETLQEQLQVPVVGVIVPGARAACKHSKSGRIGVIGTRGVINSGVYVKTIQEIRPDAKVYSAACPLFVPFAEEGWTEGDVIETVARTYLSDLLGKGIDTLVLGCTHYPLLREVIAETAGESVRLVDSAEETAFAVTQKIEQENLRVPDHTRGNHIFLVSDDPKNFAQTGARFLGYSLEQVEWVDVCDG